MKIAAYHPFTLSDFPGKTAAIVFTQGCNFRCTYCHNPALLGTDGAACVPAAEVETFLEKRKGKLEGLVISGGEPTLQPGLEEFIRMVRGLGYGVKLDTNGSRPEVLARLLKEKLLDYVAMDIKGPPEKYAGVAGVPVQWEPLTRSMRLLIVSGVEYEFRTTVDKQQLSPGDLLACGEWLKGTGQKETGRYYLQPVTTPRATANYTAGEFTEICGGMERIGVRCRVR